MSMAQVALELQPCCGKRSGIGMYTYELAKRMQSRNGLEFVGNVFNFLGRNDNTPSLTGIEMPIRTQKSMPYGVYRRIWHGVPLTYSMMFPPADLSVFFNYIVPPRIQGHSINTICDMTYLRYPETMDQKNLTRISKDIHYSIERSDAIVTISEFSKREIHDLLDVPNEKISVIYSAASLSDEMVEEQEIRAKYAINRPYMLYIGNVEPRKNVVRLLHAYRMLKKESNVSHQLVLAGGGGWRNEAIYRELRDLEESGDVILTGYISTPEKNALYAYADAFVFPSIYEGFGMPPLEAMHFGCPVVCANAASLPEVVGGAAQLVDPMDVVSIADGIWKVLSNQGYAAELIKQGYEQEKKFTWERSAQQLEQLCHHVLEGSSSIHP